MLLGSKPNDEALKKGVTRLDQQGPSKTDTMQRWFEQMLMLRYYLGGTGDMRLWMKWSGAVRDRLVKSQVAVAAEDGSWFDPAEIHAESGGRLWQTAPSIMTLEIYYRHLTIYGL